MKIFKFSGTNMLPNIKSGKWVVVRHGFKPGDVVLFTDINGGKAVKRVYGSVEVKGKHYISLHDDNIDSAEAGLTAVEPHQIIGHLIWPLFLHDNTQDVPPPGI